MGIVVEVVNLILSIIQTIGYPGIFGLMLLEGMLLPIPSEVVMLFGGYLVVSGGLPAYMNVPAFALLVLAGTLGNLVGAYIAYAIGRYGGIPLIMKFGKYVALDEKSVRRTEEWFRKYGPASVFFTRLVPVFRTFISIPAGIGEMDLKKFLGLSFAGSLIWDIVLVYLGMKLGRSWEVAVNFFDKYTYVAVVAAVLVILYIAYTKYRSLRRGAGN
ncbi:alkaline phosphatase [Thermogymnomonas acidicola]|uniref:Alkaline phosphatase n=1 Tax=Thermogymnomonas acidicola TaxID=399579 RepID=A0AA37BRI0_9ARCH|nr:DedA family protein [Thermogymnomonas acidicola]GGM73803.1 alkaline phosphatase [Thermogymnomonas acidicola]